LCPACLIWHFACRCISIWNIAIFGTRRSFRRPSAQLMRIWGAAQLTESASPSFSISNEAEKCQHSSFFLARQSTQTFLKAWRPLDSRAAW
jgi:hypothetical protein